jgi:heptosyltransferase II
LKAKDWTDQMKLGIFLPSWVGDACLATPTIRSLRQGLSSDTELIGIGQPSSLEVFEGLDWFSQKIAYQRRPLLTHRSRWTLASELRDMRLDATILLPNSLSAAIVAFMAGVPRRIGYDRDGRGLFLTDRLAVPMKGRRYQVISVVDYYLAFAEFLGCSVNDRRMQLAVSKHEEALADQLWNAVGFQLNKPTVVINSSGAFGQSKLWPQEHVQTLAKRIATSLGHQVLLHCGPGESRDANVTADACDHDLIKSMGHMKDLPLGLSKAVLKRAAVVVSTDSGPRHLAVAMNRPVVSLFGPTDPAWTVTYNKPEVILRQNLACQPCYERTCPLAHHDCMRGLAVERVFHAVARLLHHSQDSEHKNAHRGAA